jgi:tetratricopeptide (TPR) repeat protein
LNRLKKPAWLIQSAFSISWITALLFLIHPVQTQTVCYIIQGQLEGLTTLTVLLLIGALCIYSVARSRWIKNLLLVALAVISILATGTKEIAIVAPLLVLCWDWFFIAQQSWASLRSRLFAHVIISSSVWTSFLYLMKPSYFFEVLGCSIVVHNNPGNVITSDPHSLITPFYWLLSQCKVLIHYLYIFIWPFSLSMEYDWRLVESVFAWDFIVPALFLTALALLMLRLLRKPETQFFSVALLWFFISMLPRTSIIPGAELCVDYKTYMGSIGLLFIVSCLLVLGYQAVSRFFWWSLLMRPVPQALACMLIIAPLLAATSLRQMVWSSGMLFWGDIIAKAPSKARAYNNYGIEFSNQGDFVQAIPYFKKALEIDPNYADALSNCAVSYASLKKFDEAIIALEKSLKINPLFPEGYNNIAGMYQKIGDFEKAERALLVAIKLRPHYGKAWHNLGLLYAEQEKIEKAYDCFRVCCYEADLDDDRGFHSFAKACVQLKRFDHAIAAYERLISLMPRNEEAHFHLANVYFLAQHYDQAIARYQKLLEKDPNDPRVIINVGEAYYAKGEPANALTYFQKLAQHTRQFPSVCLRMARCYGDLGESEKAHSILREFYTLNPSPSLIKKADELRATIA